MLLETGIVPSLMMSPYDMMNPYDCEPESTNSDTFFYLSRDMSNRPAPTIVCAQIVSTAGSRRRKALITALVRAAPRFYITCSFMMNFC